MIKITDSAAGKLGEALRGADLAQKFVRVFFDGFG